MIGMAGRVLFQMSNWRRERLLANHRFYVIEAKRRLLDQFTDEAMKADADKFADDWLASPEPYFHPYRDDESDILSHAGELRGDYYFGLTAMQKLTRLSVIAGMYHEWEKQLREWVASEWRKINHGNLTRDAIWTATFDEFVDFLECWDWPIRSRPYFRSLHHCHLVVNVYKHGEGTSFNKLHKDAPQFLVLDDFAVPLLRFPPDYTNLTVTDDHLCQFSEAIVEFWQEVPEDTFALKIGDLPKRLKKAIKKDQAAA